MSNSPLISCICVTYGRPEHVNEAVQCFLSQDYPNKELIVFNTFPGHKLTGDFQGVDIINCRDRPASLGQARNMSIHRTNGQIIAIWDDDDRYLPAHLSTIAKHFSDDDDWIWLDTVAYMEAWQVKQFTQGSLNVFAFRVSAWNAVGGYPAINSGEDRELVDKLRHRPGRIVPIAPKDVTFCYHWANGLFHISGRGKDEPGKATGHQLAAEDLQRRVHAGIVPTGDVAIAPGLKADYAAMVAELAKNQHPPAHVKTCLIYLGRFGDIANILPVAKHIADTEGKPAFMVSREFASILDGVSYVHPHVVDYPFDQIKRAEEEARANYAKVINAQVWGQNFRVEHLTEAYNKEAWRLVGHLDDFYNLRDYPLVFDLRDKEREAQAVAKVTAGNSKPLLLVNVTASVSSAFAQGQVLLADIVKRHGQDFNIVNIADLKLTRIFDVIGLMDVAAGLVCIDSAQLHLATASKVRVVAIVNPAAWLGSELRYPWHSKFTYSDVAANPQPLHAHINSLCGPQLPVEVRPRRIFHVYESHADDNPVEIQRKKAAQRTWSLPVIYSRGLVDYPRNALTIGDVRALPYLRDVLAVKDAQPDDIIMFTNDDIHLHPKLPDFLLSTLSKQGACCAQRIEYPAHIMPNMLQEPSVVAASYARNPGRDMFAFTKRWLDDHWDQIPDFILGASEWDWCLAMIIRKELGVACTREALHQSIAPADIPLGYVAHQYHPPVWMQPGNVNRAPSQLHNKELFRAWLQVHEPHFAMSTYPGPAPARSMFNGKQVITVRRSQSLGDVLAATCVATALMDQGYEVNFQSHNSTHCILRRHPRLKLISLPDHHADVDLDGAYETHPERTKRHFADLFIERANKQLSGRGIKIPSVTNYAPRICSDEGVRRSVLPALAHPKPWIMVCPRSEHWPNRTIPDPVWIDVAPMLPGTKFWLGMYPAPVGYVDLNCRHVDRLIEFLGCADLLITVDSGPLHIAAALGTPCVAIEQASSPELHLSDQRDFIMVQPPGLDCLNCQATCRINPTVPPCQNVPPQLIASAANARLRQVTTEDVSAIISVYKPPIDRLNRCIEHLFDQVQEIVVIGDLDTPWPLTGLVQDAKIKVVRKNMRASGYGKKCNYGARHSNGKYLWFINDDCFVEPGIIHTLRETINSHPHVAIVTHLLLYPNRTVQYGGKYRPPGAVGFGHIDHRATRCRYTKPVEQESLCGASMLIRRRVFFDVNGYDEDYYLYSEDDDLAMRVRQAGYKILFDPRATGIHEEHQSTGLMGNLTPILERSNALFHKKWGAWFDTRRGGHTPVEA